MKGLKLRRVFESISIVFVVLFVLAILGISHEIAQADGAPLSWQYLIAGFDIVFKNYVEPHGYILHASVAAILAFLVVLWRNDDT